MALREILIHLRMKGSFSRGQLEDEPAVAEIDMGETENVTEELAIRLGILGVEKHMRTGNHGASLAEWRR